MLKTLPVIHLHLFEVQQQNILKLVKM